MTTTRRALLRGLAGAATLVVSGDARAFGGPSRLDIGEWTLPSGTTSRPSAWRYLLSELERTTSVVCEPRAVTVDPSTPALAEHPFAVLLVEDVLPTLDDAVIDKLSAFLAYGGFLFIDDTTGGQRKDVDESVRALVARLFPTRPLSMLPADHSLHRAFFLLQDGTPGRVAVTRWMEAVTVQSGTIRSDSEADNSLSPLVYGRNDLSGALVRSVTGQPMLPCSPGGEAQRNTALKVGINLVMYALTANYKKDQAHVRQLILDRRLPQSMRELP